VRGYKLTFFLAAALLIAALLTKLFDKREMKDPYSNAGPWFLLAGGIIMTGYGYYEYYKKKANK
jgi:drug/metabolite transporter (DMT)-like permease